MKLFDVLFGKPLASNEASAEHIGVAAGCRFSGLDGLTSAAYGPEAAMLLLVPLGFYGVQHYLMPIFGFILTLLIILYFSYRQTIEAYPNGGGSFTVASENLGDKFGLLAAAALMIDYILTAAVGVSGGVSRPRSAFNWLHPYQLILCLVILVFIAIVNMRGVKETGFVFMVPTFLFVGTLLATIAIGITRTVLAGGHPTALAPPPPAVVQSMEHLTPYLLIWLLMKAFSNGCAAMTRRRSRLERRHRLQGTTFAPCQPDADRHHRDPHRAAGRPLLRRPLLRRHCDGPDANNYQTVLSIEVAAVFGRGWFYLLTMGSVLAALSFSANTAFADSRAWPAPSRSRTICRTSSFSAAAACSSPRHLRAHRLHRHHPHHLRRRHRPPDPALRHRRVPGLLRSARRAW